MQLMRLVLLLLIACAAKPPPPAPPTPIPLREILGLELRGPDSEEARGKGCPLEAIVELADGGEPVLRFRCTVYGSGP